MSTVTLSNQMCSPVKSPRQPLHTPRRAARSAGSERGTISELQTSSGMSSMVVGAALECRYGVEEEDLQEGARTGGGE